MDCYLIEGQKVLYRVFLALFRFFAKATNSDPKHVGAVKKHGLRDALQNFAKDIGIPPSTLLNRCFKFRDFGRLKIQKHSIRIEIDIKSKGITGSHVTGSLDNLPSPKSIDDIRQVSTTLTYKQVGTDS